MKLQAPFLILLVFLSGCSFGTKEKEAVETEEPVATSTFITYELAEIKAKKGPCVSDSSNPACLDVDINYPVVKEGADPRIMDSINAHIKADIFQYAFVNESPESFESLIAELEAEYKDLTSEFPDYSSPWNLEISSDIIYQAPKFISVATSVFSYTGGAHPNSFLVYRSYDLTTGKAVALSDFLTNGFEAELNRSAEIEFRMNYEIPPSRTLSEAGFFFENDEFRLNNNFAIIEESLVFYFNPYEIASYAQGPSELELRLTDYVKFIKPGGIIDGL